APGRADADLCGEARRRRAGPWLRDVQSELVERPLVRVQARSDDLPRSLREPLAPLVQHAVVLRKRLAGVLLVKRALVAGRELALLGALADVLVRRPALRPPVRRRPRIVVAALCDVMAVLVGDDRLRRDRRLVLADRDD